MPLKTETSKIMPTLLLETWLELVQSHHQLEVRTPVMNKIVAMFGSLNAAEDYLKERYNTENV